MAVCLEFPHDYDYGCDADDLKLPLDEFQINDLGFEESEFNCRKEQSIQGDVAKIAASRSRSISGNWQLEDIGDINDMNILVDTKRDMRNGDCMWSAFGTANTCHSGSNNNSSNNNCSSSNNNNNCCNSNSNSAASSYNESRAVPPSIVMLIKPEMCDDDDQEEEDVEDDDSEEEEEENRAERCNSINNINKLTTFATSDRITIMHNKNRTMATMQQRFSKINTHKYSSNSVEQHIPPGASLLRKSNPPLAASAGLKSSGSMVRRTPKFEEASCPSTMMAAPPVFRHTVDLAACLMGSNNISLTTGSIGSGSNCDVSNHHIIDHISRELQNEKSRFDSLPTNYQPQITDVLDYISQQVSADAAAASSPLKTTAATATAATTTAATTTMSPPATNSDCDSDDGDCSMVDSSCGSSSYMRHISDHSYTRSEMETNLETPSDSDEEIDVVSLNDKKLPTNPSDRDRRALQTKVAHKISTIPPPRRNRFELPYTPASSSPVKSEANSRFPSPSSTPYQSSGAAVATVYSPLLLRNSNSSSSSSSSSSAGSDCATPASTLLWGGDNINTNGGGSNKSSRKRYQDTCRSSAFSKQLQASKKSRAKLNHSVLPAAVALHSQLKQQPTLGANSSSSSSSSLSCASSGGSNSANSSSNSNSNSVNFSIMKRQFSMDEADTIEKRNLHNDMERQRRIGLKNLFEALKKQIPNIRDKERAPKVNILREAAKLCEQLTNEERELSLKRQLLKAKQKQRQEMIARLRLSANAAE